MKIFLMLFLSLGLGSLAASVNAESTLDKYLKKGTAGSTTIRNQADVAGVNKVYKGAEGYWYLDDNRASGGACAITYVATHSTVAYVGPTAASTASLFVLSGPHIPPIQKANPRKVSMIGKDGVAAVVPVIHAPNEALKEAPLIIVNIDLKASLAAMEDVDVTEIVMDKKQVFAIKWQGGLIARAAMQKCLDSKPQQGAAK